MNKNLAKTPIKTQNLGLGLKSKNVPYPKKLLWTPKKFFLTSKGPPSIPAKNEEFVKVASDFHFSLCFHFVDYIIFFAKLGLM